MDEADVRLTPDDLVDGYGFDAGQACDRAVDGWAAQTLPSGVWPVSVGSPLMSYLDPAVLLGHAISEHLAPTLALPPSVVIRHVGGAGNPFRLVDRQGTNAALSHDARVRGYAEQLAALPDVVVTPGQLAAMCVSAFPSRAEGWLRAAAVLDRGSSLAADLAPTVPGMPAAVAVHAVLDVLAEYVDDGVLALAAEMSVGLDACGDPVETIARVSAMTASAHLVAADGPPVLLPSPAEVLAAAVTRLPEAYLPGRGPRAVRPAARRSTPGMP